MHISNRARIELNQARIESSSNRIESSSNRIKSSSNCNCDRRFTNSYESNVLYCIVLFQLLIIVLVWTYYILDVDEENKTFCTRTNLVSLSNFFLWLKRSCDCWSYTLHTGSSQVPLDTVLYLVLYVYHIWYLPGPLCLYYLYCSVCLVCKNYYIYNTFLSAFEH